jgi:hypothetical protein
MEKEQQGETGRKRARKRGEKGSLTFRDPLCDGLNFTTNSKMSRIANFDHVDHHLIERLSARSAQGASHTHDVG